VQHVGDPFETPKRARIARLLEDITASPRVAMPYWTDAALLATAGIPTVLFGPAGQGPHADVEFVELASVERVAQALRSCAIAFCR
jgi:acetylornithine deacetylase